MLGELGQLFAITNAIGSAVTKGIDTSLEVYRIRKESDTAARQRRHELELFRLQQEHQNKELTFDQLQALRREELFKDIALYTGLGLGGIILIVSLAITLRKRGQQ